MKKSKDTSLIHPPSLLRLASIRLSLTFIKLLTEVERLYLDRKL